MTDRSAHDAVVERLHGPAGEPPYTEGQVSAAEARLGVRLPHALRELYLSSAARWTGVIHPASLAVGDGALVFWEDYWREWIRGVRVEDLGRPDPPVVEAHVGMPPFPGPVRWLSLATSTRGWAVAELYRLAASDGRMRFSAAVSATSALLAAVAGGWPEIPTALVPSPEGYGRCRLYGRDGQVFAVTDWTVCAGAATEDDRRAIERGTGGLLALSERRQ